MLGSEPADPCRGQQARISSGSQAWEPDEMLACWGQPGQKHDRFDDASVVWHGLISRSTNMIDLMMLVLSCVAYCMV